jgi:ATP-dependent metalloprotease FtsH
MFRYSLNRIYPNFKNFSRNFSTKNKKIPNNNLPINSILLGSTIFSVFLLFNNSNNKIKLENISLNELKEKDDIEKINIIDNNVVIIKRSFDNGYYRISIPNSEYFDKHFQTDKPIYFDQSVNWLSIIPPLISLGILGTIIFMMSRNVNGFKGIIDLNKSAEVIENINIKFKDVIGQKNARRSVEEFVDIIKNKDKYLSLGVTVPKGALLSGPPGTGKTLIAKAIAGESNLPFINMTGSDFNAMFVGVGSAKIKSLYNSAKEAAEKNGGCIVFIDEIDAIGQKRSSANTFGGNSERENTLNQLLTEMDGFDSNKNVITFAATNRPELLDPALLRPGRFDRKILVDLPTRKDRRDLFNYYLQKLNLDKNLISNISELSSNLTPGFSGADIANVVNEAGIIAVRNKKNIVEEIDIKNAIDYVMMGNEKDDKLLEKEEHIVSFHEAGHAYLSYILPDVENPVKVSIIPREKGMLGFSQSEVSIENLISKNKIEQYINVLMAGRICEDVFCNDITNGASNDMEKATELANKYIKLYGFSDNNKFMSQTDNNLYKNDTSNFIRDESDKEVINFLNFKYEETYIMIYSNKENIKSIKDLLFNKKTIYFDDLKSSINHDKITLKI